MQTKIYPDDISAIGFLSWNLFFSPPAYPPVDIIGIFPRHPNTSSEGIWTQKTYLKHLLGGYLDV